MRPVAQPPKILQNADGHDGSSSRFVAPMAAFYLPPRNEHFSKHQAQTLRATAATVRRTNTGSVARCGPSTKARQMCASVIKPKTVPVVMRYAFINPVSVRNHASVSNCPPHIKPTTELHYVQPCVSKMQHA